MALADTRNIVRRCPRCQFFFKQQHVPAQALWTIPPSWPFTCWGLDSVGPLKMVVSGYNHIFMAIDKFTKWIEVKPIAAKAAEFIEEISHRFGVPNRIIRYLGTSFTGSEFWDYCQESCIDIYYASVAHPRCNGQVERANGLILQGLKARIFDPIEKYGSKWIQELPRVVWGLRTQGSRATGYSPFFMVYGSEAILPTDITFGAPHT